MINENLDMTITEKNNQPMTLKNWICTYLLLLIPIANIVLIFMWAFGKNVNRSKKTFMQMSLIFGAIIGILYIVFLLPMTMEIINSIPIQ